MSSMRPLSSLVPFVEGGCHNYHDGGDDDDDVLCILRQVMRTVMVALS